MLQKPENITKELFLAHVDKLQLRFPVATIAQATGFSKSNVSQYLKGNMMPSVNFLRAFYKWLSDSNINVSDDSIVVKENVSKEGSEEQSERVKELKERVKSLEKDKEFIHQTYGEKIKQLQTSLDASLKNQQLIQAQISVAFHLIVEQLVDDKKRDEILNEFDKLTFADRH